VFNHRAIRNHGEVLFSDALISDLAADALDDAEMLEARARALEHCRQKLSPIDQELLDRRYEPGATSHDVARALGRPVVWVYKALSRIRRVLFDCTTKRLSQEGQER
jgi:RNA polymerase sigma-70 factor (ECF subfamily)